MQPLLIHYLNYFLTLTLTTSNFALHMRQSMDTEKEIEKFCLTFFFKEFFMIDVNFVFIALQVDRLIAIMFPYFYQEEVSAKSLLMNTLFPNVTRKTLIGNFQCPLQPHYGH